jgi:hypothetical protein
MKAKIIPLHAVSNVTTSDPQPTKHQHRCPLCGKTKMATNEVCGMSIDHVFACILCLQNYFSRLHRDMKTIVHIGLD